MVRKIMSILITIIMVLTIMIPINVQGMSKDYAGHWAEDTIQSWLDDGYVTGYPDGSFKPDGPITRAEFVRLVNNLFDYTETSKINFTDVTEKDWYYQDVQKAFTAGYISGVSETLFSPNDLLTREQAAIIVSKIINLKGNSEGSKIFTDSDKISDWAKDYVSSAASLQLLKGYNDNSFKPKYPISRAEALIILSRAIGENYLVWNIGNDPTTWDPTLSSDFFGSNIIQNMFEGLTRETANGIVPAAAKNWDISKDGETYIFHLREGLKWSDGESLTAKDFEYALKRACDPEVSADYSFLVTQYLVKGEEYFCGNAERDEVGVKAIDDLTLEVKLKNPTPYFLNLTSMQTYMPLRQDIVEANGMNWEKNPETCISNGPFKLADYKIGSNLTMVKNENYWDAENVILDGIKGLIISDGTEALNEYENGKVQVLDNIEAKQIPILKKEDSNFKVYPQIGTFYVQFNVDNEVFDDVRVRKAFSLAIDRTKFVEEDIKGVQTPATGFIPAGLVYSDGTKIRHLDENGVPVPEYGIDPNKASVEEAQALLAEAGYPNGKGLPEITYLYNTSVNNKKMSEALREMWKQNLGVDIKLVEKDWGTLQEDSRAGNFMMAKGGWIGDYGDPLTMLNLFISETAYNDVQWRYKLEPVMAPHDTTVNKEQEAYEKAILDSNLLTGTKRDAKLKEAEDVLMNNMIIAPIFYYTTTTIVDKTKVEGVVFTLSNKWDFRNAKLVK